MKRHILPICLIDCSSFLRKFVKDNAKILALGAVLTFGGYFVDGAYGGTLRIHNYSSSKQGNYIYNRHILRAQEGKDGYDAIYSSNDKSKLHIYSVNNLCYPNKLVVDSRNINSTTTFNHELYSKGFPGTADNSLKFKIVDSNDFEWKNLFLGDVNDSNDIVSDVKYLIISGVDGIGTYNLPALTGNPARVYDKRKIVPRNYADLNRDRKVNLSDYAIFAGNFGRTGIVKGSDVNDLGAYADMTDAYDVNSIMISYGDGTVNYNDLSLFVGEWLWDANDPNTW